MTEPPAQSGSSTAERSTLLVDVRSCVRRRETQNGVRGPQVPGDRPCPGSRNRGGQLQRLGLRDGRGGDGGIRRVVLQGREGDPRAERGSGGGARLDGGIVTGRPELVRTAHRPKEVGLSRGMILFFGVPGGRVQGQRSRWPEDPKSPPV